MPSVQTLVDSDTANATSKVKKKKKKVSVPAFPLGPPTSTPQPVAELASSSGLQVRLSPGFAWL